MGNLNEVHQSRVQYFQKNITAAANAGQTAVADVKVDKIAIEAVVLRSEGATTGDLTTAALSAGPNTAETTLTLLSTGVATQANLDAAAKQVSEYWSSGLLLNKDEEIVIDLQGTGATAVDLTVLVAYRSVSEGGGLA